MPVQVEIARPAFVDSDTPNARQFNDVTVKTATVPDAAATTEGVVRLAGDLAGTADAPQLAVVSSLNAGEYGKTDLNVPSITVDAKGRVTKAEDRALPISADAANALNAETAQARWEALGFATSALATIIYKQVMQLHYPIGEILITRRSGNPNTWLGFGTWVAHGGGRMIAGHDGGDGDFNAIDKTGGGKTHTLTQAQLPAAKVTFPSQNLQTNEDGEHQHEYEDAYYAGIVGQAPEGVKTATIPLNRGTSNNSYGSPRVAWLRSATTPSGGKHKHTFSMSQVQSNNLGTGAAINHLPPYQVYFIWRRTA